uniref:Uncharacterized protein n=1 Tax=Meloidogyne enterolobii TaxID=390850 RepID=A0A6V7VR89_MELEN|nr:unnamed protein product [Meloidogyne enterolobii]
MIYIEIRKGRVLIRFSKAFPGRQRFSNFWVNIKGMSRETRNVKIKDIKDQSNVNQMSRGSNVIEIEFSSLHIQQG